MAHIPHVLSIAGSDPSGGAGIQADLKTFAAFRTYGMAVVTSLTAQNTKGVTGIHDVPPDFVRAQLAAVFEDIEVHAAKTGMLKSREIIEAVAESLGARVPGRLVVDPVMVATSGDRLIEDVAVEALRERLVPLASLVTPNRAEAEVLAGRTILDTRDARAAAEIILALGCEAVLVKGIRAGSDYVDLLVTGDGAATEHRHAILDVGATHGTGCTLSSAIAAGLALGLNLFDAVTTATRFVLRAIRAATPVGGGALPLNHLVPFRE